MIAILVATGHNEAFAGLQESMPVPLLALADRPFLQHIVEYLANQGIRGFEFILSHLPEKIEAALGDGARWGCSFRYHLLPAGGDPLRLVRTIAAGSAESIVLGTAECLPEFHLAGLSPSTLIDINEIDVNEIDAKEIGGERGWSGWGVFRAQDILLPDFRGLRRIESPRYLGIRNGAEFLRSQRQVLDQSFPGLLISGREADPGVWISRNVALHPTAKINPPVYIGENCRIGRGVQVGPSAVIGPNCIINEHTILIDSMVAAGTYVGEGLELDSVIVDRNRLFNIRLQTSILASEAFLLGSLTDKLPARGLNPAGSAIVAFILLLVFWPVLLLTGLVLFALSRGTLVSREMLRIPAQDDPANWSSATQLRFRVEGSQSRVGEFLFTFLPGLISVLKGELSLVGVQPRTRAEVLELPSDWRALYLTTKAGLITEAAVMFGHAPSDDEFYTAEAFYSATESFGHDCRLFGLWFLKLITGPGKTGGDLVKDSTL